MYLEGLVVCINFADFLATTLPRNRPNFDQFTVVTSPDDKRTRLLARQHDCKIVETTRHLEGKTFNKAKAINDGLTACSKRGFLVLLDADIALLLGFRREIQIRLNQQRRQINHRATVYGVHRYMCWSNAEWRRFVRTGHHKWELEKKRRYSQAPAGYFQMWYPKGFHRTYPENWPSNPLHTYGGYHGDLAFAKQFAHCRHLPQPYVVHLATPNADKTDHCGRTSAKW